MVEIIQITFGIIIYSLKNSIGYVQVMFKLQYMCTFRVPLLSVLPV
jgi:hypothetical protein